MTRLKGHALLSEGIARYASHTCNTSHRACREYATLPGEDGDTVLAGRITVQLLSCRDNDGHARCSCGTESPHLPSQGKRRAWHRQHKTEVSEALTG